MVLTMSLITQRHGAKISKISKISIRQFCEISCDTSNDDLYGYHFGNVKHKGRRNMLMHYVGADQYMKNAIRRFSEKPEPCVAQVVSGFSPFTATAVPSINKWMREATVKIRLYTHADMLSDDAIRYITKLAAREDPEMALFFLNVANYETIKKKPLQDLNLAFTNAAHQCSRKHVLICGLPNAGKSSIVNPLTRAAILCTKKKRDYHFAKISQTAGHTASVKTHRLDESDYSCFLIDTPGLLPPPNVIDEHKLVLLAATGSLTNSSGPISSKWDVPSVAQCILLGLNAHADLSGVTPPYVHMLEMAGPTTDSAELLERIAPAGKMPRGKVLEKLIKKCRQGALGGIMLEMPGREQPIDWKAVHAGLLEESTRPQIRSRVAGPIVYMNKPARELTTENPMFGLHYSGS